MNEHEPNEAVDTLNTKDNQLVDLPPDSLEPPSLKQRAGKIKYGCLAWLIGLPLPIVILLMFYKGCDF